MLLEEKQKLCRECFFNLAPLVFLNNYLMKSLHFLFVYEKE